MKITDGVVWKFRSLYLDEKPMGSYRINKKAVTQTRWEESQWHCLKK